jgi:WhiB family redox-sensing transcriptional regulator
MDFEPERWWEQAACSGVDTELFFPPRDKTKYKVIADQAKEYCFGPGRKDPCPVRLYCLWEAIEEDVTHGIWGGLSHRERNALIRKWQKNHRKDMTLKEYIFQLDKKGK